MQGTVEINVEELIYKIGAEIDHSIMQQPINMDYIRGLKKAQQILGKILDEKEAAIREYMRNELKLDA